MSESATPVSAMALEAAHRTLAHPAGMSQPCIDKAMHVTIDAVLGEDALLAARAAVLAWRMATIEAPLGRLRLGQGVRNRFAEHRTTITAKARKRPTVAH